MINGIKINENNIQYALRNKLSDYSIGIYSDNFENESGDAFGIIFNEYECNTGVLNSDETCIKHIILLNNKITPVLKAAVSGKFTIVVRHRYTPKYFKFKALEGRIGQIDNTVIISFIDEYSLLQNQVFEKTNNKFI